MVLPPLWIVWMFIACGMLRSKASPPSAMNLPNALALSYQADPGSFPARRPALEKAVHKQNQNGSEEPLFFSFLFRRFSLRSSPGSISAGIGKCR
jgi:hypothetical protein